ncbi:MAG: hypothetical protein NVSMB5_22580 [Candidatus Velthaea sp.]
MQLSANSRARSTAIGIAAVSIVIALAFALGRGPVADALERVVGIAQNAYSSQLGDGAGLLGWRLYLVAFAGGLVSSFSPCILGMLPVNLSYIGAAGLRSRRAALIAASTFVLGVVLVNAALGLASSLFFAVFVQDRAYVNIGVGIITVAMGLWMAGLIRLRMPSATRIPTGSGPFAVGIVFALVASPCASPILIAVLSAAAKTGSPLQSALSMVVYALGYTAILFLASVFAGIAVTSRRLLAYGGTITRVAAVALVLAGLGTAWYGLRLL